MVEHLPYTQLIKDGQWFKSHNLIHFYLFLPRYTHNHCQSFNICEYCPDRHVDRLYIKKDKKSETPLILEDKGIFSCRN